MDQKKRIKRNVVIYIIGSLALATIGGIITAKINEAGQILFILSPILMMVLLRFFGGDGWKDAGLGLNIKQSWLWYLFSILLFPVSVAVVIVFGMISGLTTVNVSFAAILPALLAGFAAQLIPRMIFAMFEEWGWRGYLEPRLTILGVPDLKRHLFVGVIWSIWHFPLILSTDYTDISFVIFFPLFIIGVLVMALVYGQLRKHSKTVWTPVLLHGIGNAFIWAIIKNNFFTFNNKMLAYIAPESVFSIVLCGLIAFWLIVLYNKKAKS